MRETLELHRQSFPGRQAFDTAVSRALLHRVAERGGPGALRLYRPDEILAFSVYDRTRPGFVPALAAARAQGFAPVVRLAGGRAAVFHRETLAFSWARPSADPRQGIRERFDEMAEIVRAALEALGVDARIGAVPGEYCPGDHSVNARGERKLAGIGQRIVRGAAHVGGVVVVGASERARRVLIPVYRALGFDFDPASVGSIEDEIGSLSCARVAEALLDQLRLRYELVPAELESESLAAAAELEPHHRLDGAASA